MTPDEKDRFGDKLRDVEKAREDKYFAERDRALLDKLRTQKTDQAEETLKEVAHKRCPRCGEHLVEKRAGSVTLDECPSCHGIWLDKGELDQIGKSERQGWLSRYLGLGD